MSEAQRWLDAWAAAAHQPPGARALALLGDGAADLSLGARDAALLRLRGTLFGGALAATARCPACTAPVELGLDVEDFAPALDAADAAPGRIALSVAGVALECRPIRAGDVPLIEASADPAAAVLSLCILHAERDGQDLPAEALPEPAREAAAAAILDADPAAELVLALSCPECGARWNAALDPAEFLWRALDDWAWHSMEEVHRLATAHGWTEHECLSLPPARRAAYIAMLP
jgi:hypothetical protein